MKEQFDKTKSNDYFITTTNPTYQEQLNKNKYFGEYNNINNVYNMNLVPKNRMNILQKKPIQQKKLSSDLNYKALCIIIVVLVFLALISFLLVYFIKREELSREKAKNSKKNEIHPPTVDPSTSVSSIVNEINEKQKIKLSTTESQINNSFTENTLNAESIILNTSTNKISETVSKTN